MAERRAASSETATCAVVVEAPCGCILVAVVKGGGIGDRQPDQWHGWADSKGLVDCGEGGSDRQKISGLVGQVAK